MLAALGERAHAGPRVPPLVPAPRAPRVPEMVFDLEPYGILGDLRFNNKGYFRATCRYHDGQCKRQRQNTAGRNQIYPAGRPIGALILWLKNQKDHFSQVRHVAATIGSRNDRIAARQWFKTLPGVDVFLDLERERRQLEPEEPLEMR